MKTTALDPLLARSIIEAAPAIVMVLEPAGCIEYVNPAFEALTGLSHDDVRGQEWCSTCLPHRDRARTRAWYAAAREGLMVPAHVTPIVTASGPERDVEWQARVLTHGAERPRGVVCVGRTVAARHGGHTEADTGSAEVERALRASEARLRRAQSVSRIGSWEYDLRTHTLEWSDEIFRILELDPRTTRPTREPFFDRIHPEDRPQLAHASELALAGRLPECVLHRLVMPDGRTKWVEERWELELDERGRTVRIVGTTQDVTERRHAEEEIRRSRDMLGVVIDSSPDLIFAKDAAHRFLFVNRAFADRRGSTVDAMLGRLDHDFWPEEFRRNSAKYLRLRATDEQAMRGESTRQVLEIGSREDGTWRAYDAIKRPLQDAQGRAYGVLVYSRDITQQQLALEAHERAVAEKEMLLREIHHRVKNNLQVVSSLMHFQAKKIGAPTDRAAFEDGRKRLLAMMLVHEKLYQSKELSAIEFALYAKSLFASLVASFDNDGRIRTAFRAVDVRLDPEVALHMGMVLCELITNAFKYAFPGNRTGTVDVAVDLTDGQVVVNVRDNGVGLPVDFDPAAPESFGWYLVNTLASQLDARLEVERDAGTGVRIVLPRGLVEGAPVGAGSGLHRT